MYRHQKIALAISATCGTLITVMIPKIVSGYDQKLLNFPNNTSVKIECLKIAGSDRYKKTPNTSGGKRRIRCTAQLKVLQLADWVVSVHHCSPLYEAVRTMAGGFLSGPSPSQ